MSDELAIQKTISTYSQTASFADWDQAVGTYLPDGVMEVPHLGLVFSGRDAVKEGLMGLFSTMEYVLQLNSPALIEIDGDTATARSGIRECGKTRGRDEGFEFFGQYVDTLVRTAEGWKFSKRVFRLIGQHNFPLSPMVN